MELPGAAIALALTPGLVQFLKDLFGWEGKAVTALSFVVGAVLIVALNLDPLIPGAGQWVSLAVGVLSTGLAASGYYKLAKHFTETPDTNQQVG